MLRAAVIGCGLIATRKFLPILGQMRQDVRLVGICDADGQVLAKAAAAFPGPHGYTDSAVMLAAERPDLVVICTPPASHTPLVTQALRAGAHVLVEKPMALTTADCAQLVRVAAEQGRKLGVMHNQVFNPAFEAACDAVARGEIGQFLGMRIFLLSSRHDMTADAKHWAHRLPGGMVGETGPHAVYLSLALLKNIVDVQVRATKQLDGHGWCEADDIRIDLVAENGISSICLMYGSNQTAADIEIVGTEGVIRVDLQTRVMTFLNRPAMEPLIAASSLVKSVAGMIGQTAWRFARNSVQHTLRGTLDGHYVGVKRFVEHVAHDAPYGAPGVRGQEVVSIMETIVARMNGASPRIAMAAAGSEGR